MQLSATYRPYTNRVPAPRMTGVPGCARMVDLLNVAEAYRLKKDLPLESFYCNLSQGIKRRPFGSLKTLTKHSHVYDFEREVTVSPLEELILQGMPVPELCSEFNIGGAFAGNAMFTPCAASVLLSFFLFKSVRRLVGAREHILETSQDELRAVATPSGPSAPSEFHTMFSSLHRLASMSTSHKSGIASLIKVASIIPNFDVQAARRVRHAEACWFCAWWHPFGLRSAWDTVCKQASKNVLSLRQLTDCKFAFIRELPVRARPSPEWGMIDQSLCRCCR
jgi:hypothetical protein